MAYGYGYGCCCWYHVRRYDLARFRWQWRDERHEDAEATGLAIDPLRNLGYALVSGDVTALDLETGQIVWQMDPAENFRVPGSLLNVGDILAGAGLEFAFTAVEDVAVNPASTNLGCLCAVFGREGNDGDLVFVGFMGRVYDPADGSFIGESDIFGAFEGGSRLHWSGPAGGSFTHFAWVNFNVFTVGSPPDPVIPAAGVRIAFSGWGAFGTIWTSVNDQSFVQGWPFGPGGQLIYLPRAVEPDGFGEERVEHPVASFRGGWLWDTIKNGLTIPDTVGGQVEANDAKLFYPVAGPAAAGTEGAFLLRGFDWSSSPEVVSIANPVDLQLPRAPVQATSKSEGFAVSDERVAAAFVVDEDAHTELRVAAIGATEWEHFGRSGKVSDPGVVHRVRWGGGEDLYLGGKL